MIVTIQGALGTLNFRGQCRIEVGGTAVSWSWITPDSSIHIQLVDHSVVLGSSATQSQAGRVITATFKHSSGDVIDLRVGDASEPRIASNTPSVVRVAHRPNELGSANSAAASPSKDAAVRAEAIGSSDSDDSSQVIGTTSNHPFWSVDRREYVQAGKLELGERVLTYSGDTKRVLSKLARPGPQPVYNLEVFAEHVYYVGKEGVLVHNAGGRVYLDYSDLSRMTVRPLTDLIDSGSISGTIDQKHHAFFRMFLRAFDEAGLQVKTSTGKTFRQNLFPIESTNHTYGLHKSWDNYVESIAQTYKTEAGAARMRLLKVGGYDDVRGDRIGLANAIEAKS